MAFGKGEFDLLLSGLIESAPMEALAPDPVESDEPLYDQAQVYELLQRIMQSKHFARAESLSGVLLYLWEHRNEEISEYAIATEALGRRSNFDPKLDASVRVQIARLRRKLKDFYESEGSDSAYILQIPLGSHCLVIREVASGPSSPVPTDNRPTAFALLAWIQYLLGFACIALLILSSWLLWDRHEKVRIAQRPIVTPTRFWAAFVGSGTPIEVILPTPLFFVFPNSGNIHVRDINVNDDVNDILKWKASHAIASLAKEGGTPSPDHSYTVASDTLATIDLGRYFDSMGIADRVTFAVTDDSTMDLLEKANVVAFGAHSTLYPFRDYLASMNFSLALNEDWIQNAHPDTGELPRYSRMNLGNGRGIELGIVAVLPGRRPNIKLLLIQSHQTAALVSMLTSQVGNNLFEKMYAQHGSPTYFEMAVEIELSGGHVIRSWPVALHSYNKPAPTGADVTR